MWPNPQFSEDFITFTGEILNGKLHFLCSVNRRVTFYQFEWENIVKEWTEVKVTAELPGLVSWSTPQIFDGWIL